MGSVTPLLDSLGPLAAGALLRFTPTRRGAASVALASDAEAQPAAFWSEGRTLWRGLEPTDSRRYTVPLPATAVKMGQLSIPGG